MAGQREAFGFNIGGTGDGSTGKLYAVNLKEENYKGIASLLGMKKLNETDLEKYQVISITEATRQLIMLPLRISYKKGKAKNGNIKSGHATIYIPRDKIEEAIDNDKGLVRKKYNGFPITDVYAPRKRVVTY